MIAIPTRLKQSSIDGTAIWVVLTVGWMAWKAAAGTTRRYQNKKKQEAWSRQESLQISLLRDVVGNPFRPMEVDPSRLSPTAIRFAKAIYDERAFDRMPRLAEVLEEAGCHDAEILGHCRGEGPHVRGCWVVDLLLGKK